MTLRPVPPPDPAQPAPPRPTRVPGLTTGRRLRDVRSHLGSSPAREGTRQITRAVLDELLDLLLWDADASQAGTAFLRLVNTGHTVTVLAPDGTPLPESTARVNAFAATCWALGGGGSDKLIGALALRVIAEGGAGIEIEVDSTLTDVVDCYPFSRRDFRFVWHEWPGVPDPAAPDRWARTLEKVPVWRAGGPTPAPVNPLQTPYQGLDVIGERDPYGHPPLLAAIAALEHLDTYSTDVQRVTHFAGFGRTDITVDHLAIMALRSDLAGEALTTEMERILEDARAQVADMDPDEDAIHYGYMTYNRVLPADLGGNLAAHRDELVRRVGTALKTIAVILGANEGSTTTHATVQWQIYAKLLEEAQRLIQRLLEAAYACCLRVWGLPGRPHVEFAPIRQTDRTIEALADATEQTNWQRQYADGLISHAEYCQHVTGHDPAGDPPPTAREQFELQLAQAQLRASITGGSEPVALPTTPPPDPVTPVAQPGTDAGLTAEEGAARATPVPTGNQARAVAAPMSDAAQAVLGPAITQELRDYYRDALPALLNLLDATEVPT